MNDKTKFLSTPGRVTSTMRAIMVSNNFSEPWKAFVMGLSLRHSWEGCMINTGTEVPIQIKSAKIEASGLWLVEH